MAASLEGQERQRRDLILNFAHELRTPLTNLHGYMEGLREGVVEPGPEIFAALQGEVARLNRLSHSLEALAEGVDPERRPEELDLVALIKALLELNKPRFEGGSIKVNVDLPAQILTRCRKSSRTSCRTRPATRRPRAPCGFARSSNATPSWFRWPTPVREFPRATSAMFSSASTASRNRATRRAVAPASASPLSSSWSRPSAGRWAQSRRAESRASGSGCRHARKPRHCHEAVTSAL